MAHHFGFLPSGTASLHCLLFPYKILHTNIYIFTHNWWSLKIGLGCCSRVRCLPSIHNVWGPGFWSQKGIEKNLKTIRNLSVCKWIFKKWQIHIMEYYCDKWAPPIEPWVDLGGLLSAYCWMDEDKTYIWKTIQQPRRTIKIVKG